MIARSKLYKSGYVAIVGRPNVGKSTLLNYILGQKLSIISRKPQTTRQNLLGIYTSKKMQCIFVDTPGLHLNSSREINRYMNKAARTATEFVNIVIHICDVTNWTTDDDYTLDLIKNLDRPIISVINKIDLLTNRNAAIPKIEELTKKFPYNEIIPVSALQNININTLLDTLINYLPYGEQIFPKNQITTASMRFMVAEIVREKLFKVLQQELPYSLTVVTDSYKESNDKVEIFVTIIIARASQKPIIIGKGGKVIKIVGTQARKEIEDLLNKKVNLKTWVKIKENWSDNSKILHQLGFNNYKNISDL